jgi:hypothetical protein
MLLNRVRSGILFKASLVSLILFNVLPLVLRVLPSVSVGIIDAARGTLLGTTIGLVYLFFRARRLEQGRA